MTLKLTQIDEKIQQLKKKREKLQIHQSLSFLKEAQRIFKEEFSPEIALVVLDNCWRTSSDKQRKEWQAQIPHFHLSHKSHCQKDKFPQSTAYEN